VRLIERGWKFLKSNPIINGAFIFVIILGILLIAMIQVVGFSKSSGTETIEGDIISQGHGHDIKKGDIIEVTYEVEGEDVNVYIVKGYSLPLNKENEDVLVNRPNSKSGTIIYEAKEDGMHMVFFEGRDLTFTYSYKVIKPLFSVFIIALGLILIGIGLGGMWYIPRTPNPKYLGNTMKYISLIFGLLGAVFLGILLVFPIDEFILYLSPFYMILFGVQNHYLGKLYNKQYNIRCIEQPSDSAEKIKSILDKKGIRYREQRSVKEYLMKWDTIIDFEGTDTKVRIRKLPFQREQSMVLVGRQNALNRTMLTQLANEIARELECRNYVPVS
jgi:hypothetical protein